MIILEDGNVTLYDIDQCSIMLKNHIIELWDIGQGVYYDLRNYEPVLYEHWGISFNKGKKELLKIKNRVIMFISKLEGWVKICNVFTEQNKKNIEYNYVFCNNIIRMSPCLFTIPYDCWVYIQATEHILKHTYCIPLELDRLHRYIQKQNILDSQRIRKIK